MNKHFELTNETLKHNGRVLYRIRATKNLYQHKVKIGQLGGFIEKEDNLQGNAWVDGDAIFTDDEVIHMESKVNSSGFWTKFKLAISKSIYGDFKKRY